MDEKPICRYLVLSGYDPDKLDFCFKCKQYPDFSATSYRMIVNCISCHEYKPNVWSKNAGNE